MLINVNFHFAVFILIITSLTVEVSLSILNLAKIEGTLSAPREKQVAAERTWRGMAGITVNTAAFMIAFAMPPFAPVPWDFTLSLAVALCLRVLAGIGIAWLGSLFAAAAPPASALLARVRTELLTVVPPALCAALIAGDRLLPWEWAGVIGWALFCVWRETSQSTGNLRSEGIPAAFAEMIGRTGLKGITIGVRVDAASADRPNARAEGIGPYHRIVIDKGLIDGLPIPQSTAVIAHESGHIAHRHREKFLALRIIEGWLALAVGSRLGMDGIGVGLLILALPNLALLIHPLEAALVRGWEFQADRYAARHVPPLALKAALERIFALHAAPMGPFPLYDLFHSFHPAPGERLRRLSQMGWKPALTASGPKGAPPARWPNRPGPSPDRQPILPRGR